MLRVVLALLVALSSGGAAAADDLQPIPALTARVTDLTQTLSPEQRDALAARLAELEHRKGAQVAVLAVPSVKPESIEEYAVRVMEAWKLGRKGVNDGVLLVVAKEDRKLRIEVGYGLEGALNDATSKRIVSDFIAPRFKEGDFFAGIDAGVDKIIAVVSGEALPEPVQDDSDARDMMLYFLAPGLLLLSFFGGLMLRDSFSPIKSASINAAATGGFAWIFFMTVGMGWVALVIAAISFALSFVKFKPRTSASWLPAGASVPDDDWSSRRSRSSDRDSSSSDSDSSFSGGGGESGGGGASGDW